VVTLVPAALVPAAPPVEPVPAAFALGVAGVPPEALEAPLPAELKLELVELVLLLALVPPAAGEPVADELVADELVDEPVTEPFVEANARNADAFGAWMLAMARWTFAPVFSERNPTPSGAGMTIPMRAAIRSIR